MPAKVLYGKDVAKRVKENVKKRVDDLKKSGITPGLVVVLVGEDPASAIYVKSKARACERLGIYSETLRLPADTSQDDLNALIDQLNDDKRYHGILVQLPLPAHLDDSEIIARISPAKDVDGFHPVSLGKLVLNEDTFVSCTPAGILEILKYYDIDTNGKHVVVVGRSNIVGKPMANLLYQKAPQGNATVTICHTRTRDMAAITRQADILIAAVGVPELITADMVKEGAVVIDVGINRIDDPGSEKGYRIVGDVAFDAVGEKAAAITPVPGGVGVMTIAMLMWNTVKAAESI